MASYAGIVQTTGNTPLVRVNKLYASGAQVFVKLESRNPMASVKDRIGPRRCSRIFNKIIFNNKI
jgi:cysteine synthase A